MAKMLSHVYGINGLLQGATSHERAHQNHYRFPYVITLYVLMFLIGCHKYIGSLDQDMCIHIYVSAESNLCTVQNSFHKKLKSPICDFIGFIFLENILTKYEGLVFCLLILKTLV